MDFSPGFSMAVKRTSCGSSNGLTSNLTFLMVFKNILIRL